MQIDLENDRKALSDRERKAIRRWQRANANGGIVCSDCREPLPFGYGAAGTTTSRSAATRTATSTHAPATSCAARRFLLLGATLRFGAIALNRGFSPYWPSLANIHVSRGAASRERSNPKQGRDQEAIPSSRHTVFLLFIFPTYPFQTHLPCQQKKPSQNCKRQLSEMVNFIC